MTTQATPNIRDRIKALALQVQRDNPDRHVFATPDGVWMVDGTRALMIYGTVITDPNVVVLTFENGRAPAFDAVDILKEAIA